MGSRQITLEEALYRIIDNYSSKKEVSRRSRLPVYIDKYQFDVEYENLINPHEEIFDFHTYHKEDGGEIGYRFYCKKCGKFTTYNETQKGLEVDGELFFFTNEEIDQLKQKKGMLITNFTYNEPIKTEQIKGSYALYPYFEKKAEIYQTNRTFYDLILDWLKSNNKNLFVIVKLSSGGFKNGPDIGLLSYDKEKNVIKLTTLFYSDEMNTINGYRGGTYDENKLKAAEEKLLGNTKPITGEFKTPQTKKILEILFSKQESKNKQVSGSILDEILNSNENK